MKFFNAIQLNYFPTFLEGQFTKTIYLFILLFFSATISFSQTTTNQVKGGAQPITAEQYAKLPKVNLDTLEKYSVRTGIFLQNTSNIKMLVTPPVGDQGSESSCVGWAVGYAAMGILTYPKYNCWNIAERSPAYVYDIVKSGSNCSATASIPNGLTLVTTGLTVGTTYQQGVCSWCLWPYVDGACTVLPNSEQTYDASKHKATAWYQLTPNNSLSLIKNALDLGYPLVAGFDVYDSFLTMWFSGGGIWNAPNSGNNNFHHAVCIVGYDDSQQLFKVQNSWGTAHGDQGFF